MTPRPTVRPPLSPAAEWIARSVLVVFSLAIALFGLELACRWARGPEWLTRWPNFVLNQGAVFREELKQQFVFDPQLGYVPRPGFRSASVNHDTRGFRALPGSLESASPVLAVGDSFAYGDEVADGDTWPHFLQVRLGRPVLNAGVVGYGLDQIVLRTEMQVAALAPEAVIVSFIADDIRRNEFRRQGSKEKPYFTLSDSGALTLNNVPVPADASIPTGLAVMQWAFGWSALAELIARRLGYAYEWTGAGVRATPRGTGERLACPLIRRMAAIHARIMVVGLYTPLVWRLSPQPPSVADEIRQVREVLACAAQAGLATLDTYDAIDQAVREGSKDTVFTYFHLAAPANRRVADAIADEMARRNWR